MEKIKCLVCGEEFEPKTYHQKYCSKKCSNTAQYSNPWRREHGLPEISQKKYGCGGLKNGNEFERLKIIKRIDKKLEYLREIKRICEKKYGKL